MPGLCLRASRAFAAITGGVRGSAFRAAHEGCHFDTDAQGSALALRGTVVRHGSGPGGLSEIRALGRARSARLLLRVVDRNRKVLDILATGEEPRMPPGYPVKADHTTTAGAPRSGCHHGRPGRLHRRALGRGPPARRHPRAAAAPKPVTSEQSTSRVRRGSPHRCTARPPMKQKRHCRASKNC